MLRTVQDWVGVYFPPLSLHHHTCFLLTCEGRPRDGLLELVKMESGAKGTLFIRLPLREAVSYALHTCDFI